MISKPVEMYGPSAAFLAAAGVSVCLQSIPSLDIPPIPSSLAAGTMTIGVVVAGFTATQRNMLISMDGQDVLRFLANASYDKTLSRCLRQCLWSSLALTIVSVIRFFLSDDPCQPRTQFVLTWIWTPLWAGHLTMVIATIIRNEVFMFFLVERFLRSHRDVDNTP